MAQVRSDMNSSPAGSGNHPRLNLTPASENDNNSNTSTRLSSTLSQHLSSTKASVDSDSDYQSVTTTTSTGPSRPLSRTSSSMSGVSTRATKDGVEGNIVKKHTQPRPTGWQKEEGEYGYDSGEVEMGNGYGEEDEEDQKSSTSSKDTTDAAAGGSNSNTPSPPNEPSAPPVTLNEKIRLLRTGSVSGKQNN